MVEEKPFKILAIDGGGVMGLFSAEVLAALEDQYGGKMSDYFDLICGTSTGGLIALALSAGVPASEMVKFYQVDGPRIFPYKTFIGRGWGTVKMLFVQAKYSNEKLRKALEKALSNKKMCDAQSLVCIPSYNLTLGKPKVFKSPLFIKGENKYPYDAKLSMVDVGLATSAAPTYFPIHQIGNEHFVDGGVWCNNPAICGLTEAIRFFFNREIETDNGTVKYTSIQILSVSTITKPLGWSTGSWKKRSGLLWMKSNKLIQPFMVGPNFFSDFLLGSLRQSAEHTNLNLSYERITHDSLSLEQMRNIDMDLATRASLRDISALGVEVGRHLRSSKKDTVDTFFKTFKSLKQQKHGQLS